MNNNVALTDSYRIEKVSNCFTKYELIEMMIAIQLYVHNCEYANGFLFVISRERIFIHLCSNMQCTHDDVVDDCENDDDDEIIYKYMSAIRE